MKLKVTVALIVAVATSCLSAIGGVKAVIAAIKNNYSQNVTLKSTVLKPGTEKAVMFEVPYVAALKDHRAAYIFGEPYTPKKALNFGFKDGRVLFMWREQGRGIVAAYGRHPDVAYDDSVPKTILTLDETKAIIGLKVLVDARGKLSLQQQ